MTFRPLWTHAGVLIATNFNRIEHGGRGSYYEIEKKHFCINNCHVPNNKSWKIKFLNDVNPPIDYIELRTVRDDVKIYFQLNTQYVDYANYNVGFYYVSIKHAVRKRPITMDSFLKNKR
jgi:hypothetical protein